MRVLSRVALVIVLSLVSLPLAATHLQSECPLTLVGNNPASSAFDLSPHGVFRSGNLLYALRGQTLTTYTASDVGELQVVREDFIGTLGARDTEGGVAFLHTRGRDKDKIGRAFVVVGRSWEGIQFGAPDVGIAPYFDANNQGPVTLGGETSLYRAQLSQRLSRPAESMTTSAGSSAARARMSAFIRCQAAASRARPA